MSESKTVLVTGANGFVGSHTVRFFLGKGFNVRAMVRANSDLQRLHGLAFEQVIIDLPSSPNKLAHALEGVDLVLHTAAYVDLGTVDRDLMRRINLEGTQALLGAAQRAGVAQFVQCSTVRTLGDTQGVAVKDSFVRTDTDFASCYDETKTQAEAMVLAANCEGFETFAVLPPGIFGPDDPHFGRVLRSFLAGSLPFWPAQDRPLGIVHVDDLAELFLRVAQRGQPGTRYIASAGEVPMGEIFATLAELSGRRTPRELPEFLVRSAAWILDHVGHLTGRNMALNSERVTFLYDKVVRTDPTRTYDELGWKPRPPREVFETIYNASKT